MIGIFGGTFDPVHYGHLRPLLEVKQALGLNEVRLIPCCIPPHRDQPSVTAEQRLAMLRLAVNDVPGFVIDERELERGGPSYMVDTLQSLRDEIGDQSLSLILGMDAFVKLDSWHQWQQLSELAHFVVTQRPGVDLPTIGAVAELVASREVGSVGVLRDTPAGHVFFQEVSQLDIAATRIRKSCSEDKDIRFLLPEAVREYIEEQNLYK